MQLSRRNTLASQLVVWLLSYSRVSVKVVLAILLAPFTIPLFRRTSTMLLTIHRKWFSYIPTMFDPLHYIIQFIWIPASNTLKAAYQIWVRKGFETLLPMTTCKEYDLEYVTTFPKLSLPPRRPRFKPDTNKLRMQIVRNIEAKWRRKALTKWVKEASIALAQPRTERGQHPRVLELPEKPRRREKARFKEETRRELFLFEPAGLVSRASSRLPPRLLTAPKSPPSPIRMHRQAFHASSGMRAMNCSVDEYPLHPGASASYHTLVYLTPI
ncbi:hypothetical protein K493DRAFT_318791 [Basidiobolus meristosporus CBS 931.73]|uniref:Uncharacterized protein n=1 Tax=Basidiobolus meristosporus CBS 931.73 TaxID=1314790 RepID=A0A1Y1XU90_9FUNG|nr:hypothetical protein K493DRAFT_318791 [Basidiobolus meristosporus CBS 931.73]|eukprot:ORX89308.1 hypothetical protein K493DRAFT_318791 [Basidiobolus meristosporus CBS 931.73]